MINGKKEVKNTSNESYEETKEKVLTSEFSLEELLEIDEAIDENK